MLRRTGTGLAKARQDSLRLRDLGGQVGGLARIRATLLMVPSANSEGDGRLAGGCKIAPTDGPSRWTAPILEQYAFVDGAQVVGVGSVGTRLHHAHARPRRPDP
jgi:hypothetical protein